MSVVVPAHDEARTIPRLLRALAADPSLEVVVVCNGCSDDTAAVARAAAPAAVVVEIPEPSKREAVRVGNERAQTFPRVHLDADVEIDAASLHALVAPLADGVVHATAPARDVPRAGCAWPVRAYYDVWERLPQVRSGLFGRGVVALSATGQARVSALPAVMNDDLVMSEAFAPAERQVVEAARVVVRPPRTLADLVRRRVRVATGSVEADRAGLRGAGSTTSPRVLLGLLASEPTLAPKLAVFLGVTLVARRRAARAVRRGDFTTWLRDESSRA